MDIERIASGLRKLLMAAGGAALLLLVLLATGNVALRIVRAPVGGAYEVVAFLGAIVIAGALGHTQKEKDHIVVEILSERFPPPVKRVLDAFGYAVSAVLFGIVTWRVFAYGLTIQRSGELSETLKVPFHPFVYGVGAGFAVLVLTLLLDLLGVICGEGGKR
ncbi:MAG: TRAP transporter small permease [Deltaproteobacteria bacterium]